MGTGIEFLAAGNCVLRKDNQNPALARDYKNAFELD
jgi:carbamoyltransferase